MPLRIPLLFLFLFSLTSLPAVEKKPNIILLLVDDMGWPDLGCYAQDDFHESPHIDSMAAQGLQFNDAYAPCGVCSPSRASIMTGKYPAKLQITDWIPGSGSGNSQWITPKIRYELPLEETTIAEALKPAGYNTYHVGKWHLGEDPRYWPLAHGFDINIGGHSKGAPGSFYYPYAKVDHKTEWTNEELPEGARPGRYLTDFLTDKAIGLIEKSHTEKKPFYLNMCYYTVHVPLEGRPDYVEKFRQKQKNGNYGRKNLHYAAMVKSLDDSVGRILKKLKELNIEEETFIILTSDNGGLYGRSYHGNKPLKAGKGTHYEGGIREPFIIHYPGKVKNGGISKTPVHGIDIFPTILDVAGVQIPEIDGLSLKPLFQNPTQQLKRQELFWHFPHFHHGGPVSVIRSGNYKLLQHLSSDKIELFDLSKDISEENNLAEKMPEKSAELLTSLKEWKVQTNAAPLRPRNTKNNNLYGRKGSPWKGANDIKNPVVIKINNARQVTLSTFTTAEIYYTLDGSEPTKECQLYKEPFSVADGAILKTRSFSASGIISDVLTEIIPLPSTNWNTKATSESNGFSIKNAFDGDPKTYWQASPQDKITSITFDFKDEKNLSGFIYQPAKRVRRGVIKRNSLNDNRNGAAQAYEIAVSKDGKTWTPLQSDRFHYTKYAFLNAKVIHLKQLTSTRFIKIFLKEPFGENSSINMQSLKFFGPAQGKK